MRFCCWERFSTTVPKLAASQLLGSPGLAGGPDRYAVNREGVPST